MFDLAFSLAPFAQGQGAGGGLAQIIFMLAAFGGIVYFLIWRPQQQQRKRHEEMVGALKRGDDVILQGGMHGKITRVHDDLLDIEIAPDVVIKQVKSMILTVNAKTEPQAAKSQARKSESDNEADADKPAAKRPRAKAAAKPAKKAAPKGRNTTPDA